MLYVGRPLHIHFTHMPVLSWLFLTKKCKRSFLLSIVCYPCLTAECSIICGIRIALLLLLVLVV